MQLLFAYIPCLLFAYIPCLLRLYIHTDSVLVHFYIELNGNFDQSRVHIITGEKTFPYDMPLGGRDHYAIILADFIEMLNTSLCFRLDTDLGRLLLHIDLHRNLQYFLLNNNLGVDIFSLHFAH